MDAPPPPPPPPPPLPELSDPSLPLPMPAAAPWEQLPTESDLDYQRFIQYVKADGPVADLARALGLNYEHVRRISARHRWRARRASYQCELNMERRQAMKVAAKRNADAMLEGWRLCMDWAIESVTEHRAQGRKLDPRDAATMMKASTEALRLLDGEPGARVAVDLGGMSLEKLDQLSALLEGSEDEG